MSKGPSDAHGAERAHRSCQPPQRLSSETGRNSREAVVPGSLDPARSGAGRALALREDPAWSTDIHVLCRTSDSFLPTLCSKTDDARNSSGRKEDGKLNHRRRVICGLSRAFRCKCFRCKCFSRRGWAPGSCDRYPEPGSTRLVRTTNPTRPSHLPLTCEPQPCVASSPLTEPQAKGRGVGVRLEGQVTGTSNGAGNCSVWVPGTRRLSPGA